MAAPKLEARSHRLSDGTVLHIREATPEDARAVLSYVEHVSGESDFLSFGPGEFELAEAGEEEFLARSLASPNQLYILGTVGDAIVAALGFSGGRRPRVRHSGGFGLTVREAYWGLGIGSLMMDTLIDWARATGVVTKVNLRVRTDNQRAIRLYRNKGFVIEGTIRRDIRLHGRYFDTYWMGLEL